MPRPPLFRAGFFAFSHPISSPLRSLFHRFHKQQPMVPQRGRREIGLKIKGMIFRLIRDVHAVCNFSLCGLFLMILDFIRGIHAVDFRRQNDLCQIIVWFDVFYAVKCRRSFYASLSTPPTFLITPQTTPSICIANYSPLSSERGWGWGFICLSLFYILLSTTPRPHLFHHATRYELFFW